VATTNYFNTLIEVAEDCPRASGEVPPVRGERKSVANLQFELLAEHPYELTSDDVIFAVYATRKGIAEPDRKEAREHFFAKGQPCLRASPLTKRYGWGVHSNEAGRIALVGVGTEEYARLVADASVTKIKAMRSRKA
jgi:hypothetical protein